MIIPNSTQAIADPAMNGDVDLGQDQGIKHFTPKNFYNDTDGTKGQVYYFHSNAEITIDRFVSFDQEAGFLFSEALPKSFRSKEMSDEIDDIYNECSTPNWDGYGARPVYRTLRKTVERFLDAIPQNLPNPELGADPDGEISLDWCYSKGKMFTISIGKNDRIAYALLDKDKRSSGVLFFKDHIPSSMICQLNDFLYNIA